MQSYFICYRLLFFLKKKKRIEIIISNLAYSEYETPFLTASREMEENESEQNCAPIKIASSSIYCKTNKKELLHSCKSRKRKVARKEFSSISGMVEEFGML